MFVGRAIKDWNFCSKLKHRRENKSTDEKIFPHKFHVIEQTLYSYDATILIVDEKFATDFKRIDFFLHDKITQRNATRFNISEMSKFSIFFTPFFKNMFRLKFCTHYEKTKTLKYVFAKLIIYQPVRPLYSQFDDFFPIFENLLRNISLEKTLFPKEKFACNNPTTCDSLLFTDCTLI